MSFTITETFRAEREDAIESAKEAINKIAKLSNPDAASSWRTDIAMSTRG